MRIIALQKVKSREMIGAFQAIISHDWFDWAAPCQFHSENERLKSATVNTEFEEVVVPICPDDDRQGLLKYTGSPQRSHWDRRWRWA